MTRPATPGTAVLALLLLGIASPLAAQTHGPADHPQPWEAVIIKPTEREFLNSCASCHGADGTGAGFLTRLFSGINPGDLTQLSAGNNGTFPMEHVFSVIDGRAAVAAHGDRKMPVWGDRYMNAAMSEFGPDEINEFRVRNRIYELVHYLQSIQEVSPEAEN
jgi:hypothetical protein